MGSLLYQVIYKIQSLTKQISKGRFPRRREGWTTFRWKGREWMFFFFCFFLNVVCSICTWHCPQVRWHAPSVCWSVHPFVSPSQSSNYKVAASAVTAGWRPTTVEKTKYVLTWAVREQLLHVCNVSFDLCKFFMGLSNCYLRHFSKIQLKKLEKNVFFTTHG